MLNPVKQYTVSLSGIIFFKNITTSVNWKTGSGWPRERELGGLYWGMAAIWKQNQGSQDQGWEPVIELYSKYVEQMKYLDPRNLGYS